MRSHQRLRGYPFQFGAHRGRQDGKLFFNPTPQPVHKRHDRAIGPPRGMGQRCDFTVKIWCGKGGKLIGH